MKLIKDNVCYIDNSELKEIPEFVLINKHIGDIAIIKDEVSVDYYNKKIDILDLDNFIGLSEEELDDRIIQVGLRLKEFFDNLVSKNEKRKPSDKATMFKENYKIYSKIYKDLVNYKNNKEEIDNNFKKAVQVYNEPKRKVKRKK